MKMRKRKGLHIRCWPTRAPADAPQNHQARKRFTPLPDRILTCQHTSSSAQNCSQQPRAHFVHFRSRLLAIQPEVCGEGKGEKSASILKSIVRKAAILHPTFPSHSTKTAITERRLTESDHGDGRQSVASDRFRQR